MKTQLNTEWQNLETNWEAALRTAADAQRELDEVVERHLTERGPAPSKQKRLQVEDLFCQQCEARGALDQYIEEHCG